MRPERRGRLHRFEPVVGRARIMAHDPQNRGHAFGGVSKIVHHQNAALAAALELFAVTVRLPRCLSRFGDDRHLNRELAARAGPTAAGFEGTAVQLDQSLGQRQPDAEAALRPLYRRSHLGEQPEDVRQMFGGDADAGVSHRDHCLAAPPLGGQPDVTGLLGVLGGVVQQVGEDLGQPDRVGAHHYRLGRQRHGQFVGRCFDERAGRFDGGVQYVGQIHSLRAKL